MDFKGLAESLDGHKKQFTEKYTITPRERVCAQVGLLAIGQKAQASTLDIEGKHETIQEHVAKLVVAGNAALLGQISGSATEGSTLAAELMEAVESGISALTQGTTQYEEALHKQDDLVRNR